MRRWRSAALALVWLSLSAVSTEACVAWQPSCACSVIFIVGKLPGTDSLTVDSGKRLVDVEKGKGGLVLLHRRGCPDGEWAVWPVAGARLGELVLEGGALKRVLAAADLKVLPSEPSVRMIADFWLRDHKLLVVIAFLCSCGALAYPLLRQRVNRKNRLASFRPDE